MAAYDYQPIQDAYGVLPSASSRQRLWIVDKSGSRGLPL